jgi:hypothetical protein
MSGDACRLESRQPPCYAGGIDAALKQSTGGKTRKARLLLVLVMVHRVPWFTLTGICGDNRHEMAAEVSPKGG